MRAKILITRLILKFFPLRKPSLDALPRSILFFPFDANGDLLYTTAVFQEIKHVYPQIKIGVIVTARNKMVLQNNPFVDGIYESNKNFYLRKRKAWRRLLQLRREKYDLVIDLWDRTSLILLLKLKLVRPRKIVGLRRPREIE